MLSPVHSRCPKYRETAKPTAAKPRRTKMIKKGTPISPSTPGEGIGVVAGVGVGDPVGTGVGTAVACAVADGVAVAGVAVADAAEDDVGVTVEVEGTEAG